MTAAVYTNFAALERVDTEKGVIYGVSVITIGEALGHGLWVDELSLNQILQLAKAKSNGVKVRAEHTGKIFDTSGKLINFRRDGNCVRADFELLKSDENFDKILEMAEKLPTEFGLSVSTAATSEKIDGKKMVRFTELESTDLVGRPAANPNGLFSALTKTTKPMIEKIELCKFLKLDETASEEVIKAAFASKCKADMEAETELESKKKLAKKKDEDEKDEKDEKFEAIVANVTQLSAKLEAIEAAGKLTLEAAKKNEIAGLLASASAEGKVCPLTDVQLSKMDMVDVKDMFTKLPKGQLRLSKTLTTSTAATSFKTDVERIEFCRTQRDAGAAQLTANFAAAGLVQLN